VSVARATRRELWLLARVVLVLLVKLVVDRIT
jgi:hypothetical protein